MAAPRITLPLFAALLSEPTRWRSSNELACQLDNVLSANVHEKLLEMERYWIVERKWGTEAGRQVVLFRLKLKGLPREGN